MKKLLSSRASIVGIFILLLLILGLPLVIFTTQEKQDIRQRASQLQPSITLPQQSDGYISGYVYEDSNQNGERENGEAGSSGIPLKITQIPKKNTPQNPSHDITTVVITDRNGYFKYRFPNTFTQASFIIKLDLVGNYKTVNTNPRFLTDIPSSTKEIIDFGIFPIQQILPSQAKKPTPQLSPKDKSVKSATTTNLTPTPTIYSPYNIQGD